MIKHLVILLGWIATASAGLAAEPDNRYAIAIHGGAGGAPSQFDQATNEKIRARMEQALTLGVTILKNGGSSLDAVEQVVEMLENDPQFNSGKGAVMNAAGGFELDSSIMDGSTLACGAVAGVTIVKNPIDLARRVMTETRHVLLAGRGADQFAREQGVALVDQSYFATPQAKAEWERQRAREAPEQSPKATPKQTGSTQGTVGCVALDMKGNLAAGTSTGGLSNKKFGRVGDSPIVGAGTYADNATCAVSCTGRGEEYIRLAVAYDVSARMRYSKVSLAEAVQANMTERLAKGMGGIIAVDHDGNIAMEFTTGGMPRAAADSSGRFDVLWMASE